MELKITKRQKDLLKIIYKYIKDTGYAPAFEEMREALGVCSNQSVLDHLKNLEHKGFIQRNKGTARSLSILPLGYKALKKSQLAPFLGSTSAGLPMQAIEITGEWQTLPTYKASKNDKISKLQDNIFLLKVSGDSMINAGINNNDIVLVKESEHFISGDIVLARIGDESTVKRFISQDEPPYMYLKPENPKYDIIPFDDETTEMQGKVVSVLRDGEFRVVK